MPPPDKFRDIVATINDSRFVTNVQLIVRIKQANGTIHDKNPTPMDPVTDGTYVKRKVNVKKDDDTDKKVYLRVQVNYQVGGMNKSYYLDGRSPDHV